MEALNRFLHRNASTRLEDDSDGKRPERNQSSSRRESVESLRAACKQAFAKFDADYYKYYEPATKYLESNREQPYCIKRKSLEGELSRIGLTLRDYPTNIEKLCDTPEQTKQWLQIQQADIEQAHQSFLKLIPEQLLKKNSEGV
jgi:hypothetical protein